MSATPKRRCLNWSANRELCILKALAWVVWFHEPNPNAQRLWSRIVVLCEPVIEKVTGEQGVTFARVCEHTLATQGAEITPNKLAQRADKMERYDEWNGWESAVLDAYGEVIGAKPGTLSLV